MTLRAPPPTFPQALENDADEVVWALRTAGVQWNLGETNDAIEWLLRAVEMSIDAGRIERAREIQRNINDLNSAMRSASASGSVPPPSVNGERAPVSRRKKTASLPPLPPPPGFEALEAETLEVDVDVDVDIDDDLESLEVLEPEVLDEPSDDDGTDRLADIEDVQLDELAAVQLDDESSAELADGDIEALADSTLEVAPASIRVEDPPPFAPSEPPTAQVQSSELWSDSAALRGPSVAPREPSNAPLDEPDEPTLPPPAAKRRSVPLRTGPPPLPTAAPAARAPTAAPAARDSTSAPAQPTPSEAPVQKEPVPSSPVPSVPGSRSKQREPWRTSPSFGDNLGAFSPNLTPPPASVVFRAASSAPAIDESLEVAPPPAQRATPTSVPPAPATTPPAILGIHLSEVRGLEDLPEDAQNELARSVEIHLLEADEEVTGFGLALVLEGRVSVMPAVMDVVCVQAGRGELIFAECHVEEAVSLKVVAAEGGTRVAAWPIEHFAHAIAPCPWVRDELRTVGDRLQAIVGAAMGRMGEQLDEQLRQLVFDRCSIKLLLPGEAAAEAGKPLTGMTIVGAGRLELVDASGKLIPGDNELGPGDFVFPAEMLRAAFAPATARAGRSGALIVFADRRTAHELLMSVPPLIEVLSA